MNNMLNSKLLELLSGVDPKQLEQVSNMVKNMSKQDIENLTRMLGVKPSTQQSRSDQSSKNE